jgi:hypothetical protein
MLRIFQHLKNNLLARSLFAAILVTTSVALVLPSTSYAVSADLKLEISGIECDLEALYGNNDPSTVTIPPYCTNAPEVPPILPPATGGPGIILPLLPEPVVSQPNKVSYRGSILKPLPIVSNLHQGGITYLTRPSLPEVDRNRPSLIAKSAIDAVIASLLIAILFVAFILGPWLSKLHK